MNIWLFLAITLSVAMICGTSLFAQYLEFIYKQKQKDIEEVEIKEKLKDWRL